MIGEFQSLFDLFNDAFQWAYDLPLPWLVKSLIIVVVCAAFTYIFGSRIMGALLIADRAVEKLTDTHIMGVAMRYRVLSEAIERETNEEKKKQLIAMRDKLAPPDEQRDDTQNKVNYWDN
ncbi:MAG: hypothetical protein RL681_273 [Candidatus Parcubacteria bacterium]|jgi:hypothetical protein